MARKQEASGHSSISTTRALRILAFLCTCMPAASACSRNTRSSADRPALAASPGDHGRAGTDEHLPWVIHTPLSPCDGMPWFVSVVRDFDEDGFDDLLLGCSNKLAVSFGAPSTLEPEIRIDGLDRLLYSAASLARGQGPAFLLGGNRTTSVIVVEAERGERGWEAKTRLVELDVWRDDAGEARPGRVQVLGDEGALSEGIAYAAGPGAIVELEWSREADQPGVLQVLRSWPVPELGDFDRLSLVDLRGDGARSLVLLAEPQPLTNRCSLVVLEWPTRQRAGHLELGEPRKHVVPRACASLPGAVGGEPGLPLRLEGGGVALLRLDDDRVDTQLEFAAQGESTTPLGLFVTTPLALFVHRSQPDSSRRLCVEVVARHLAADPGGESVSFGSVSKFLVEDGAVAGIRSIPLPEGLSLGAVAHGDFDGDGRSETLFVDEYYPRHILGRGLGRGCEGSMQGP